MKYPGLTKEVKDKKKPSEKSRLLWKYQKVQHILQKKTELRKENKIKCIY